MLPQQYTPQQVTGGVVTQQIDLTTIMNLMMMMMIMVMMVKMMSKATAAV